MKTIVVNIQNGLLAEAITRSLRESGEFKPFLINGHSESIPFDCETLSADILLMEVSYAPSTSLEIRLNTARELRENLPKCKTVMLCDENSAPDIAREVMLAKKDGRIDAFFFSSVTQSYLNAALCAL